jgi:hypothetical protein
MIIQTQYVNTGDFSFCSDADIDCALMDNSYFNDLEYPQLIKMAHFLLIKGTRGLYHK